MGRGYRPPSRWRSIRVSFRVVEQAYGRDNHDNAADDMLYALSRVSEWPDQYPCRFSFDTAHPNPWYHAIVFEIEGLSAPVFAQLLELLAEQRLIPEGG